MSAQRAIAVALIVLTSASVRAQSSRATIEGEVIDATSEGPIELIDATSASPVEVIDATPEGPIELIDTTREPAERSEPAPVARGRQSASPDDRGDDRQLANGLRVRVRPTRRGTFAAVCVAYHVGNSADPRGYEGLAHLTEHLMFNATRRIPEGVLARIEGLGASFVNGSTNADATTYCEQVPEEALEMALFVESDRMGYLLATLTEQDLERERRAVLREQRERGRRNVGWRGGDWHREAMWGRGHPYARRDEPTRSVRRIRLSDVQWFHQRYYGPGNATIAVVSPRRSEEVHALVERYFGGLRGNSPPEIMRPPEVTSRVGYHVVQSPIRFERASLSWTTPAWMTRDDAALDVASTHLDELLEPLGAAPDAPRIAVGQWSRRVGSEFGIEVRAASTEELRATLEAIVERVREVVDEGMTPEAFEKHRSRWVRYTQRSYRRPLDYASFLASTSAAGRLFDIEDNVARFRALTAADVTRVIRRWLTLDRMVMFHHRQEVGAAFDGALRFRSRWW